MANEKFDLHVPIVIDGKDIGRIVFCQEKDSVEENDKGHKFFVKMSFMGKPFSIQLYNLFSFRPCKGGIYDSENAEITYHSGSDGRNPIIHIKRQKVSAGQPQYYDLPVPYIQSPRNDTVFPIPLCKIEVPQSILDEADQYTKKKYSKILSLSDVNVIELFLSNRKYQFHDLMERFPKAVFPLQFMSIEFFASNATVSDYQKKNNFMPENGVPAKVAMEIELPCELNLYASFFKDEKRHEALDRIVVTFFENRYAEDIMLMTHMETEREPFKPEHLSAILCRGTNVSELTPDSWMKNGVFSPREDTAVGACLKHDPLSENDRLLLLEKAQHARTELCDVLERFNRRTYEKRAEIEDNAKVFLKRLEAAIDRIRILIEKSDDRVKIKNSKFGQWMFAPLASHQEDVYILFALGMGEKGLLLRRLYIHRKGHSKKHVHFYMVHDNLFDIDMFWDDVERFFPTDKRTGDRVNVFRGADDAESTPVWIDAAEQLARKKHEFLEKSETGVVVLSRFKEYLPSGVEVAVIQHLMENVDVYESCYVDGDMVYFSSENGGEK